MRRVWWGLAAAAAVLSVTAVALWLTGNPFGFVKTPIVVGILHSQTGPMAISEASMIDAEVLALEEINAAGGLLGRPVKWVIADGKSDPPTYARLASKLIDEDKVSVVFGCWTSASRKTVLPVFEKANHLLFYPMAYEGLEISPNIIYTGAAPNQQVIPAVNWCIEELKARKFFLVGSDYVWPHSVNEIVKDQLRAQGAELVGEKYVFFGSTNVDATVAAIVAAKPDVIISAVVGDTNIPFYQGLKRAGIDPRKTPVVTFSIAEEELRKMSPADTAGHYAAWNYFESIDRRENREFVARFKARYTDNRVTSDVIAAAYNSVRLWAQAVNEAGTEDVKVVNEVILRQSLNAPEGIISIDRETRHTWRPYYLARMRNDGQFDVIDKSTKPIQPKPYPFTRGRVVWNEYLDGLYRSWGNSWANPIDAESRPARPQAPPADVSSGLGRENGLPVGLHVNH